VISLPIKSILKVIRSRKLLPYLAVENNDMRCIIAPSSPPVQNRLKPKRWAML